MSASAAIAIRCYDEPSASGLAPRTLNVLLGTGALLLAPVPVWRAVGQALPQSAEPVPRAPRAGLETRLSDFATNRHEWCGL